MNNTVTGASFQSPIEPNTLHFVSDDELLFRTRELARHETELTIVTIQHLDEIERRELYDKRGYPSLFEYAVRELHYSRGCAWRRIMVMKLCRAVPGITDKLRSGELNLTTASQLQNAIEKRARKAARKAARERASESVSVPAAGALSAGAGESASGEVQPAQAGVAGVAAAAAGAVWAPGGAASTQAAAGESAAGESAAAAAGAGWVPVGAATTQVAAGESAAGQSAAGESPAGESATGQSAAGQSAAGEPAAGKSAAAVPLPAGNAGTAPAATGVAAAAMLSPAQAGTAGAAPAAAVPAAPGDSPHATAAARAIGKAAAPVLAPAAASPVPGVARESAALPPAAESPSAWTLDQQVELVDLVANKSARETERLLAELEPEVGLPRERQRALGGGRYELRVILDQGSVDTIAKLKGWLSHVNPGFTTGQLLAHLLQQAERKYDPMRERGRRKRGTAAPARHAETCEQQLGVTNERQAAGSALDVAVSKAGSSTCATGAAGAGEGVPATGAARGSVAAGSVAAAPAPGPATPGPSVALAGGSAQNRKAQPVAAPGGEQDRRDTPGSAQNQQPPLVPDRSGDRIPRHAAGWVDAGSPAPAPAAAGPSVALAGGSAQNRKAQPVAAPGGEQDRRDTPGSAQNQQPLVVPDRSGDRIPRHAAGWVDAGSPAPGPAAAGPSVALAGGSAQNRRTQPVAAPNSEQHRRSATGSAQNQQPPPVPDQSGDRIPRHAAGWVDAGSPAPGPAAAGPSGALAGGSAQNRRTQPVAVPSSEQDRRSTTGSAQNQQPPVVPDQSGDRIPHHAAGWVDAGSPAPGPATPGPSGALAGGSAQNRKAQPVAAPGGEQDRRDTPGSAENQQPSRAANVGIRTDTEPHDGVRARLPEDGSAAPPPSPESSRERRARRHIPVAVRRAVWRRYGGACCYQDPLTGVTCGSTHLVQIDHIVPVAQGGSDDISNLRLRCSVHNRRRDPRCASYRSAPAAARGRSRSISTPSNHESS